ncbi:MAG: hypothetical protein K4571_15395 [Deltaproteobacteria bacterium]
MREIPDYEKYPLGDEEMCRRFKNWTETLAGQLVIMYRVGKKYGGEKFVKEMKEEFFQIGKMTARRWIAANGIKEEDSPDCTTLARVQDFIDDRYANFWDGYIECTPRAFEKEIKTCPITKAMSVDPEYCEVLVAESYKGLLAGLNPKFKTDGWLKLLPKGDKCCRLRATLED